MNDIKVQNITLNDYWSKLDHSKKKELKKLLLDYGMKPVTIYRRMTGIGFSPWEYEGIYNTLKEYGISVPRAKKNLWKMIDPKEPFYSYMYNLGMARSTTNFRFVNFNFRRWETTGIKEIIRRFESSNLKR